eukprot:Protomagalhaensia_sp_Gyna_25__674@NODE_1315_length_1952_cov_274_018819_g402_i1_p3_GENE_NODE_1315_length_1952_cov_274_018819_g402_i1NODE_1315_length_1952_cov_274_018819_g402_i1_p3_ORF_typecomplete_len103_score16_50DUF4834/PF16118_5/0_048_NODE_1315_length_1952_cov_274_018819_g402_i115071815
MAFSFSRLLAKLSCKGGSAVEVSGSQNQQQQQQPQRRSAVDQSGKEKDKESALEEMNRPWPEAATGEASLEGIFGKPTSPAKDAEQKPWVRKVSTASTVMGD